MTTPADGAGPFAVLLQQYRQAAGLSQEELAERAGLSARGISDLERGVRRSPYPVTVRALARALDLDATAQARLLAAVRPRTGVPEARGSTTSLPMPLSSFVGREREVAEIERLLATTRLLTLTGTGGIGKTRLALHVAAEVADTFPDGVWMVELASLADSALVPQAVATAIGMREQPGCPLQQTLADALRDRQLLLVLDNCEHLVAACAELAEALLRACPNLRILATSREVLRIAGETAWRVSLARAEVSYAGRSSGGWRQACSAIDVQAGR